MEEFLSSISVYQYADFRAKVIEKTGVTPSAWCQWASGGNINEKNKKIINEVAMEMFGRPAFEEKGGEK